jgi:Coenzyme PQQ synthesis protein D (PqqD)
MSRAIIRGEETVSEQTSPHARFELSGQVLHDSIDGEVIVIDLRTGTYYSLRDSAAELWGLVQHSPGASSTELSDALRARYESNGHDVEATVTQFLERLHDEGLVAVVDGDANPLTVAPTVEANSQPRAFVAPVLDKYTDMQDLVLIDPVHEVSGAGWPHAATEMPGGAGT